MITVKSMEFSGRANEERLVPLGEEKRMAAGIDAILARCPACIDCAIWQAVSVYGAPAGFHDHDRVLALVAISRGGNAGNPRKVALVGHVAVHVTNSGALDYPLYVEGDEEWYIRPLLLVTDAAGGWHAYRGRPVDEAARRFVEQEVTRRVILEREEVLDEVQTLDLEALAEQICE